ncbi:MAG: hypothetical protein ABJZ54_16200, partial [Luteolibacter sp.]
PRKPDQLVYWGKKGEYMNLDHFVLNNLSEDLAEKLDVTKANPEQTEALKKMAADARMELGDWNEDGEDRPASAYPGSLNQPNFSKQSKRQPKR